MKMLPTFISPLRDRLGQVVRSLQASMRTWVPRPAPALVPIPIQVDSRRQDAIQRHRHRGF
ncbi:hypothetical protein [uncultured Piscinibacter sp.]|uniref:hypothetical protein n=1 Tax=uncultured Piscinibacter sp. TaxID=1131835 RepID=UPI00262FC297|nr:hypothetical protein [uncultured Piscinibacter sp.]